MLDLPHELVILDDEEDITFILTDMIKRRYKEKVEITCFNDPNKAKDYIEENEVRIVISDLRMPNLHGLDLLQDLTSSARGIQIIVLTGDNSYSAAYECFLNGASGFLTKPIKEDQLNSAIDHCFDKLSYWKKTLETTPTI